jgi:hypothetical protein
MGLWNVLYYVSIVNIRLFGYGGVRESQASCRAEQEALRVKSLSLAP